MSLIREIRKQNPEYGYRRITLQLQHSGLTVNHKAVLRVMRQNGLLCHAFGRKANKYSSYKGHVGKVAKNRLHRKFQINRPFQKIVTDVTEVRWGNLTTDNRAYFTAFMDLYSGEILGWAIDLHPTVSFVTRPLDELLQNRPLLPYRMTIHSDQGFQYQNGDYVQRLRKAKVF